MEGGKTINRELTSTGIVKDYRNTFRTKNNRKNRHTQKNKKQTKLNDMDHFKARMNMPIGTSSFGIPITDDLRKKIERYSKEIDERIKNGEFR